MATWETFESRLLITARVEAITALRVGAGGEEGAQPSSSDLPILVGPDDRAYIPGSSLRGVVRSQVERIVRTLEAEPSGGRGSCNPVVEAEWCVRAQAVDEWRNQARRLARAGENGDAWISAQIWNGSCRVCRTFGNTWLASRVRIADLPLVEGTSSAIERRDGVSIHREKETVQNKYDFETVPAGTAFALRVTAENLSPAERGLLWLGLRELGEGNVLLGGFKGRGLGQVRLADLRIQGIEPGDRMGLRRYILHGTFADIDAAEAEHWLQALWDELEAN